MKTAIVSGANGFIGTYLCEELLKQGYQVFGIERNSKKRKRIPQAGNYNRIVADFSNYSNLYEKLPNKAGIFFHLAWDSNNSDYIMQAKNIQGACDAIDSAIKANCKRFVFVGSFHEYSVPLNNCYHRRNDLYSIAKESANKMCKNIAFHNGIEYCSAQCSMCYGAGDMRQYLVKVVIESILYGKPCDLVKGDQLYDIIPVQDVVNGLISIGIKGNNLKDYYLGHSPKPLKEIITDIRNLLDPSYPLNFGSIDDEIDIDFTKIDIDSLKKDTGFEFVCDFDKCILQTADWIKENGNKL